MKIIEGFRLRNVMGQYTVIGEGPDQVNFNKLITLNDSAAFLWKSVENKEFDENILAQLLVERYGIDYNLALRDATEISNEWEKTGLIE